MEPLLYYGYLFALVLAIAGFVYRSKAGQLVWMYLFLAGAALVCVGTIIFPSMNMGRNIALHKFNMLGLDIVLYTAIAYGLPTLAHALWRRAWWPSGVVAVAATIQVVAVIMLKLYYSRV